MPYYGQKREPLTGNVHELQAAQSAQPTKLTAVTIGHGKYFRQFFVMLEHNERGEAILPFVVLNRLLEQTGVRRGDTYTVS